MRESVRGWRNPAGIQKQVTGSGSSFTGRHPQVLEPRMGPAVGVTYWCSQWFWRSGAHEGQQSSDQISLSPIMAGFWVFWVRTLGLFPLVTGGVNDASSVNSANIPRWRLPTSKGGKNLTHTVSAVVHRWGTQCCQWQPGWWTHTQERLTQHPGWWAWTVKSVDAQWVCHTDDSTSCDLSEGDVILKRSEAPRNEKKKNFSKEMSKYENVWKWSQLFTYMHIWYTFIPFFYQTKSHTAEPEPRVKGISMNWFELFWFITECQ